MRYLFFFLGDGLVRSINTCPSLDELLLILTHSTVGPYKGAKTSNKRDLTTGKAHLKKEVKQPIFCAPHPPNPSPRIANYEVASVMWEVS